MTTPHTNAASPIYPEYLEASSTSLTAESALQAFNTPAPGYFDRTLDAFARRVILFVRQSSHLQVKKHKHSLDVQMRQVEHFNVPSDRITLIAALGESGMADMEREHFERVLRLLDTGEYGVVAVARHDRTGRNDSDNKRLLDALVRNRAVLMVDGHVFDPSVPEDRMILGIYGVFAEYENQLRSRWMRLTALAAAKRLALRIRVPSPFIWGSPDDPDFVEAMRHAGLDAWLQDLPTDAIPGRVFSRADGRRYFPLPVPDRVAVRATETLLRFIRESDSVGQAVERTMTDPAWPDDHRGEFPIVRARRFTHDAKLVEWVPIDRDFVANWALRPALRGEYVYQSKALGRDMAPENRHEVRVAVPDAFRGLLAPDEAARVAAVAASGVKTRSRDEHPRHALPLVFCSHVDDQGQVCGARLYPAARRGRNVPGYASDLCPLRGHVSSAPGDVDRAVLDTLVEALSDVQLRAHLDHGRLSAAADVRERAALDEQLRRARSRQASAAEEVFRAKEAHDVASADYWRDEQSKYALEVQRTEREVERLIADSDTTRALSEREANLVLNLASDFPELVRQLRSEPSVVRSLLRDIGVSVHVRSPGKYAYEVEVVFPTGNRATRWMFSQRVPSTQVMRVHASACLAAGQSAEDAATSFRSILSGQFAVRWSARRVHGAALLHAHAEAEAPREGAHVTLADLARRVGEPLSTVVHAALVGTLGPARLGSRPTADGSTLEVAPTEAELHTAFRQYARRWVATTRGWPQGDTARLADAARATWQPVVTVLERARAHGRRGTVVRDLAGRSYVRLSRVAVPEIMDAAEAALASRPDLAALDADEWAPLGEVRR